MAQKLICPNTVHGIGFEHAPGEGGHGHAGGLPGHFLAHRPADPGGVPISESGRSPGVGAGHGEPQNIRLTDITVSGAAHGAGGGLPAQNDRDNDAEFVASLATVLRSAMTSIEAAS